MYKVLSVKTEWVIVTKVRPSNKKYVTNRISWPYGPQVLALAESWLASLTRGLATLNLIWGLRPLNFIFIFLVWVDFFSETNIYLTETEFLFDLDRRKKLNRDPKK